MRRFVIIAWLLTAAEARGVPQSVLAGLKGTDSTELLTDLNTISRYWGTLTPYSDNAADHFGVQDVGIPSGCQL